MGQGGAVARGRAEQGSGSGWGGGSGQGGVGWGRVGWWLETGWGGAVARGRAGRGGGSGQGRAVAQDGAVARDRGAGQGWAGQWLGAERWLVEGRCGAVARDACARSAMLCVEPSPSRVRSRGSASVRGEMRIVCEESLVRLTGALHTQEAASV